MHGDAHVTRGILFLSFSFFLILLPLFSFLSTAIEVGNKTGIRVETWWFCTFSKYESVRFPPQLRLDNDGPRFEGQRTCSLFPFYPPVSSCFFLFRFSHAEYTGNGSVTCLPNRWHLFFSPSGFTRKWDFPLDFFAPSLKTFLFEARRVRRLTSRIKDF